MLLLAELKKPESDVEKMKLKVNKESETRLRTSGNKQNKKADTINDQYSVGKAAKKRRSGEKKPIKSKYSKKKTQNVNYLF